MTIIRRGGASLAGAVFSLLLPAQAVPSTLNYQGRLTDNGTTPAPITATVAMQFAIYDVAAGSAPLWQEPAGAGTVPVQVTGGIFSVLLGSNGVPLPAALFSPGSDRWLEIRAGNETLAPRQKLGANGWAFRSQGAFDSAALGGVAPSGWQARVSGSCGAGNAIASVAANGTVTCQAAGSTYTAGTGLTLTGTAFAADFAGSGAAATVARSDHAHAADTVLLISKDGGGKGTVTTSAAELPSCGFDQPACAAAFRPSAATVTLNATPDAYSSFAFWTGDCAGTGNCVVSPAANRRAIANFTPLTRTVTVDNRPNAASVWREGAVYSDPPGLYCGFQCAANFPAAQPVTLTASPLPTAYYKFHGWGGACSGTGACVIPPSTSPATVTAAIDYRLDLFLGLNFPSGVGSAGSVTETTTGLNCTFTSCPSYITPGTSLNFTATPATGATFSNWSSQPATRPSNASPCNGTGTTGCSFWISDPFLLFAYFVYNLAVNTSINNGGKVTTTAWGSNGSYMASTNPGANNFKELTNDSITLTEVPYSGHTFLGWGGACTGTATICTITVNSDKTVTANFS